MVVPKKEECYKVVSELVHTAKENLSQEVIPIPLVPHSQKSMGPKLGA